LPALNARFKRSQTSIISHSGGEGEMGLSDTLKDNIIVIVASAFAAGAGLSWAVAEKVRVEPMKDEISRLKDTKEIGGTAAERVRFLESELESCKRESNVVPAATPTSPTGSGSTAVPPPSQSSANKLAHDLPVFEATASSAKYGPMSVLDGNVSLSTYSSRWISENRETEGAWLELHLPEAATVTGVKLYMAVQKKFAGGQIRDADLIFPGNPSQRVRFPFESGWQQVDIQPVHTNLVRLVVRSVYPGQEENFGVDVLEARLVGY
jgi:hypothetical protein